eukprot:TRINITY_DN6915_c0_g3_i1.p1 TRINITY_DN6915_c0_g3~~TRINITY_DN6915_c0_g3_i1.p1  ORF type:complete len:170 (-),score=48.03 TRINITY_DN6915_c0_g3_i1:3-512(-)
MRVASVGRATRIILSIYNSTFDNNKSEAGGALFLGGSLNTTIYGSTFDENKSKTEGGAIFCSSFLGVNGMILNHSNFDQNSSKHFSDNLYNNPLGKCNMQCENNHPKGGLFPCENAPELPNDWIIFVIIIIGFVTSLLIYISFCILCSTIIKESSQPSYENLDFIFDDQ